MRKVTLIEDQQIKPFKIEEAERLITPLKTDYTEFVRKGLDRHNIQYEYENEIFTIYGYTGKDGQSEPLKTDESEHSKLSAQSRFLCG